MAAVFFYRAPTDGLGLRKLKKTQKKHTTMIKSDCFRKKIIYMQLVQSWPHAPQASFFLKKMIKWANSKVISATVC